MPRFREPKPQPCARPPQPPFLPPPHTGRIYAVCLNLAHLLTHGVYTPYIFSRHPLNARRIYATPHIPFPFLNDMHQAVFLHGDKNAAWKRISQRKVPPFRSNGGPNMKKASIANTYNAFQARRGHTSSSFLRTRFTLGFSKLSSVGKCAL